MVDLMLVNPLFIKQDPVESRLMTPYFPLGLLYLASAARQAGYSVSIFDAMFAKDDAEFSAALVRDQPSVIGIGVLATVRAAAMRLAQLAKEHGVQVIVGGADPTGRPESYLVAGSPVDVVVIGEGEATLLALLPNLLNGDGRLVGIEGIAYRENDRVVRTAPRAQCLDLDRIPFPARDLIEVERYRQAWRSAHGIFSLSLIATRGCPYTCTWCQKSVFGRSYRARSPESVSEEMALVKHDYRPDQIRIVDDVMGIDRRWVHAWRDAVVGRDAVIPFECLSRVDLVDSELVQLLKDAGCVRIAFGAESGSQRVLDAMKKGIRVQEIHRAATLCRQAGIETYFYIMLGYPGEEWQDIRQTVDLVRKTRPDVISSTIAYPLPGTDFYEEVKHRLLDAPNWDYTAENRLLFERSYSTSFYRWVQTWLTKELQAARYRAGDDTAPLTGRMRHWLALVRARLMVAWHRRAWGSTQ